MIRSKADYKAYLAANVVVVHDVTQPYITVDGIPACKISDSSVKKKS